MEKPLLVVIQGAPGTGKTTLLRRLKQDLDVPVMGKDDIKEFLFETLEQSDKAFARVQGGVAFAMLFAFAESFLAQGKPVIIEGAFWTDASRPKLEAILASTGASCVELFCHVDESTRRRRFAERAKTGSRHPAHLDTKVADDILSDRYRPLDIGERIEFDTADGIAEKAYAEALTAIKRRI